MRKVSGQDSVFDELFYDGDDVIFNLIYRIREDEKSQIYTDDRLYICAQSSPDLPVWLYMKGIPSGSERETLFALLVKIFAHNADVHINMQEPYASEILPVLAKKIDENVTFRTYTNMNVYACYTLNKVQEHGSMIRVEKHYIPQIKRLIGQMSMDAEHIELSDTEAQAYAERNAESPTLYLWRDKDEIASMARIAHINDRYARINTVVTERNLRCRGYAKMLVGKLCESLLANGITPMLYADRSYPASNAAYQRIGFEKVGEITEYYLDKND